MRLHVYVCPREKKQARARQSDPQSAMLWPDLLTCDPPQPAPAQVSPPQHSDQQLALWVYTVHPHFLSFTITGKFMYMTSYRSQPG